MSIIIDTNVVAVTFDYENDKHAEFKPVINHLLDRTSKVKLVYGGTKYLKEVDNFKNYLGLLAELSRIRKVVRVPCERVNAKLKEIEDKLREKGRDCASDKYNDGHIMALAITSGTRIIVTSDKRSMPFLRERCFYQHSSHIPKFYTSAKNAKMLSDPAYF